MTGDQLIKDWEDKLFPILTIFEDVFGEEFVELQGMPSAEAAQQAIDKSTDSLFVAQEQLRRNLRILVYFPTVTIRNEYNDSHTIQDLFAAVNLSPSGKMRGGFLLNRSTYTQAEWASDYMHSHVGSINKTNPSEFKGCCLGSGPIGNSIAILNADYNLDRWRIFAVQLKDYVATESIEGGPYHRMTNITSPSMMIYRNLPVGGINSIHRMTNIPKPDLRQGFDWSDIQSFMQYLCHQIATKQLLRFGFSEGLFYLADNSIQAVVRISNAFAGWYNFKQESSNNSLPTTNELVDRGILMKVIINGYTLTIPNNSITSNLANRGLVVTFKGENKYLNIVQTIANNEEAFHALNLSLISQIIYSLITLLNHGFSTNGANLPVIAL